MLRSWIKAPARRLLVARARARLPALAARLAEPARTLLVGLGRALETADPAAAARIARIETLRRELLADPSELEVVDHGAGRAGSGPAPTIRRPVAVACRASKSPFWSRILFETVRAMAPRHAVELGTCVGISAAYQAAAQELAGGGHLWSLEGAPALAALARRNLERLGLSSVTVVEGPFAETLEGVLDAAAPVDWAFVDGHHEEWATLAYFRTFLPHLAERAVLVFDDIAWSAGMRRAWETIRRHERVALSIGLGQVGLCLVERHPAAPVHLELPLGTFS